MDANTIERFLKGGPEPMDVTAQVELRSLRDTYVRMEADGTLETLPDGVRELLMSQQRALDLYEERIGHGITLSDLQEYHNQMMSQNDMDVTFAEIYSATMQDGNSVGIPSLHAHRLSR